MTCHRKSRPIRLLLFFLTVLCLAAKTKADIAPKPPTGSTNSSSTLTNNDGSSSLAKKKSETKEIKLEKTNALYAELAKELAVKELKPNSDGGVQLSVGKNLNVYLYGDRDEALLVVMLIAPLPQTPSHALTAWLLRKNLYDSQLLPFVIATDLDANVVVWGRVPLAQLDGSKLKTMLGKLGVEGEKLHKEIQTDLDVEAAEAKKKKKD